MTTPARAVIDYPVTTTADAGAGSLRAAITSANANPGADTISFNIAGTGPHAIALATSLSAIADPVTIDGTTEPDFGAGPAPVVQVDGAATTGAYGFVFGAGSDGSTIKGLSVGNFDQDAILVATDGNTVTGNYLGLAPDGTTTTPNLAGVHVFTASNNVVGGTTSAERNVLSGNAYGAEVSNDASAMNTIQGNYIGTDAAGTAARANSIVGVLITDADNTTIGGTAAGAGNVVSGNQGHGIFTANGVQGTMIQGNRIGLSATGAALGNSIAGVKFQANSDGNTVGGATTAAGNQIANNGDAGIFVEFASDDNLIRRNSIFANTGGSITTSSQPDPILDTAIAAGTDLYVAGRLSLNASPNTTFEIDAYTSPACGEAKTYAGTFPLLSDGSGNGPFEELTTDAAVIQQFATVIQSSTSSSDVSPCVPVVNAGSRIAVASFSFTPSSPTIDAGEGILWEFGVPIQHTATDSSGMGLFDSGLSSTGDVFGATFPDAGSFAYRCTIHPVQMTGSIKVPLPSVTKNGRKFDVTWGTEPTDAGFVHDVQVKVPGANSWKTWRNGTTDTEGTYRTKAGHGTYRFRARLREEADNDASAYSPATSKKGG